MSYRTKGARELRRKQCLPDTWRPLGVSTRTLCICCSVWVTLPDCGTRGNKMNQVDKKNDYKEIFRGEATLCSERPVDTEITSLPKAQPQEITKTCARYSRAARSRHNKQLQSEGKEIYASLYLPSRRRCHNIQGWGGQSGHKHPWTDTSTPKPSADHSGKWSTDDDRRTDAQVTAGLASLDLITFAWPNRKLGSKVVTLVKKWNNVHTLDITF